MNVCSTEVASIFVCNPDYFALLIILFLTEVSEKMQLVEALEALP